MTIKEAREKANLTQKDVANRLEIQEATFVKYERYLNKPNIITGLRIADILKVSAYEIFQDQFYKNAS
jgi:DNA-binding XRE family transcriptional regulator